MRTSLPRQLPMWWLPALVALATTLHPAHAQDGPQADAGIDGTAADMPETGRTDGLLVSGALSLVSDYRFRGVSNSDIGPALQPSLQLETASGVFLGLWGSTIADLNGANTEIDLSGGWTGTVGSFDMSAGVLAYLFPGGSDADVVELFGTAGFALGPATATLGLNWAPDQGNLARASRYIHAAVSAAIPGRPISLRASVGHEAGGLPLRRTTGTAAKWDWQVGADLTLPRATVGIAYVGTDLPGRDPPGTRANRLGRDGLVLRLSAFF